MPDLKPVCPAADHVHGVDRFHEGIVCCVQQVEGEKADTLVEGGAHAYMREHTDPSIVLGFCCGTALPALTAEQAKGEARASYTYCPIWQAAREAEWERKQRAIEGADRYRHPESAEDLMARIA